MLTILECVAGVYAPAFVERHFRNPCRFGAAGVAGVYAPAFVERDLADDPALLLNWCRRGLCPICAFI